jgi:hypothetical protein
MLNLSIGSKLTVSKIVPFKTTFLFSQFTLKLSIVVFPIWLKVDSETRH